MPSGTQRQQLHAHEKQLKDCWVAGARVRANLAPQPLRDGAVVGRAVLEGFPGHAAPQLRGGSRSPALPQRAQQLPVVFRILKS